MSLGGIIKGHGEQSSDSDAEPVWRKINGKCFPDGTIKLTVNTEDFPDSDCIYQGRFINKTKLQVLCTDRIGLKKRRIFAVKVVLVNIAVSTFISLFGCSLAASATPKILRLVLLHLLNVNLTLAL